MAPPVPFPELVRRGLARRCPRCGRGRLYQRWNAVHERCPDCSLLLDPNGEALGFYYVLTMLLTGAFVIGMIFLIPPSIAYGQKILFPLALVVYLATTPFRKGLSIALNYRLNPKPDPAPSGDPQA